jgi:hypothetical protein
VCGRLSRVSGLMVAHHLLEVAEIDHDPHSGALQDISWRQAERRILYFCAHHGRGLRPRADLLGLARPMCGIYAPTIQCRNAMVKRTNDGDRRDAREA